MNTELLATQRAAGLLLISALLMPMGMLLLFAVRGDLGDVFSQINGVARNEFVHRVSLTGWTIAALLSLSGFALLTALLQREGVQPLVVLALTGMLIATVLLAIEGTIHITFGAWAADELSRTGQTPEMYDVIFRWASVSLQRLYVPVGYVSLVLFGWAILQSDWLPVWSGWTAVLWGAGLFIFLTITRVTLPATLLIPGVAIGIALITQA